MCGPKAGPGGPDLVAHFEFYFCFCVVLNHSWTSYAISPQRFWILIIMECSANATMRPVWTFAFHFYFIFGLRFGMTMAQCMPFPPRHFLNSNCGIWCKCEYFHFIFRLGFGVTMEPIMPFLFLTVFQILIMEFCTNVNVRPGLICT